MLVLEGVDVIVYFKPAFLAVVEVLFDLNVGGKLVNVALLEVLGNKV